MAGALTGVRVLDLGHVLAAPFCTMILGDMGAEIIKVEPPIGDDSRQFGPFIKELEGDHVQSGYFISINRNKKSTCINIKEEKGKELLKKLIKESDVIIENFRPTTMTKLGLDYEELKRINPMIVYCSICGFGHDAIEKYAEKPAYDMVAQAYSGLMSITGPEGGEPCRVGTSIGDIVAGHQAAIGILSALLHREKSGRGQYIDISMVDSLIYIMENALSRYTINGEIPAPLGSAHPTITPFQAFKTNSGWIITPIGNDKLWKDFCLALNRKDLINENKYKTNALRTKNRTELCEIISSIMITKETEEWMKIFDKYKLPYSPLNNIKDVVNDEQIQYRKMIVEINQPRVGAMKISGSPFKMSETPSGVSAPAPLLGEHTDDVLKDILNYSIEDIAELRKNSIIF